MKNTCVGRTKHFYQSFTNVIKKFFTKHKNKKINSSQNNRIYFNFTNVWKTSWGGTCLNIFEYIFLLIMWKIIVTCLNIVEYLWISFYNCFHRWWYLFEYPSLSKRARICALISFFFVLVIFFVFVFVFVFLFIFVFLFVFVFVFDFVPLIFFVFVSVITINVIIITIVTI